MCLETDNIYMYYDTKNILPQAFEFLNKKLNHHELVQWTKRGLLYMFQVKNSKFLSLTEITE